jgi:hypothetical protein
MARSTASSRFFNPLPNFAGALKLRISWAKSGWKNRGGMKAVVMHKYGNPEVLRYAVVEGRLSIPIGQRFSLKDAANAHAAAETGATGKLLLVV